MKTMPRYFVPIEPEELEEKACSLMGEDGPRVFWKELAKVSFDFENAYTDSLDRVGPEPLMGLRRLGDEGLTIWGMCAGGDWEAPVYFCLYWDGKKVRAYVPTEGNPYNRKTKKAWGNGEEEEADDAPPFDPEALKQDILSRLRPKPGKQKRTLRERIEGLTFWGTGDEAYELFCATTSLCCRMSGLGQTKQAETLCRWAEEQARASEEDKHDWPDDHAQGHWGYY